MSLTRAQILDLIASDAKLDEVKALVGQVSATPTANTVLARLKELETKIDAIKDTAGVKKITDTVNAQLTGSNAAVHESLTVDNTVGGVGFAGHAANIYALITCETAQVRFTVDGTAPTTTVGHLLNPGDVLRLDSNADIAAFRAIRTGATSGVLKATFSGVA